MTNPSPSSHKAPLGRARGLGAGKTGTHHWLLMQLTTAALIPLTLYLLLSFLFVVILPPQTDIFATTRLWLQHPVNGLAMMIMIPTAVFNSFDYIIAGLLEDYVHNRFLNVLGIAAAKFVGVALSAAGVTAVITIMLGS